MFRVGYEGADQVNITFPAPASAASCALRVGESHQARDGAERRTGEPIRLVQTGLVVNALLAVVKILAGILGHSYALIADGIESVADIFGSFIVWSGLRVARRGADTAYPFGYGKAEALSAAAVGTLLIGAAIGITIEAIREIKRVSKPGRRVYSAVRDLTTVANGLGVAILSTPKGVMSDSRAREENVGGEILCNVF